MTYQRARTLPAPGHAGICLRATLLHEAQVYTGDSSRCFCKSSGLRAEKRSPVCQRSNKIIGKGGGYLPSGVQVRVEDGHLHPCCESR